MDLVDTGQETATGGRIKRLKDWMGDGTFMLTWGDGVSDVDLDALLRFHRSHGKLATLTAVRPPARFGHLEFDGRPDRQFTEKPQTSEGWINGAFFVLEPGVFDYIDGDATQLEKETAGAAGRRRPADGLPPRVLLAVHGHHPRQEAPGEALARRHRPLAHLGLGEETGTPDPMRVLVTGHNGYIGTVLVPMLLERGHEVVGLDTNYFADLPLHRARPRGPEIIEKDIRDVEADDVRASTPSSTWRGSPTTPWATTSPAYRQHQRTGRGAARPVGQGGRSAALPVRLIVQQLRRRRRRFPGRARDLQPGHALWRLEGPSEAALARLADTDFSPTYLRASTAYGLSPLIRFDLVINNLTAWALTTGLVYLKSDGTPWRPVVHVADIALAYIAALEAPREVVHDQAFNVGSTTENYQIRELAEIVKDVVPNCRIEFAPDAGPDTRCYRVDCNKIARVLHGFKPQWTARRGVEELYESYRRVGLTLEEFEGGALQAHRAHQEAGETTVGSTLICAGAGRRPYERPGAKHSTRTCPLPVAMPASIPSWISVAPPWRTVLVNGGAAWQARAAIPAPGGVLSAVQAYCKSLETVAAGGVLFVRTTPTTRRSRMPLLAPLRGTTSWTSSRPT